MFRIHGPTLTRLRVQRGWTQTQLAAISKVDRTVLSRMEKGERHGTPAQITSLASCLGVDIDVLCATEAVA